VALLWKMICNLRDPMSFATMYHVLVEMPQARSLLHSKCKITVDLICEKLYLQHHATALYREICLLQPLMKTRGYMYTYTNFYLYMHVHMYKSTCMYIHTCMQIFIYMYMHIYMGGGGFFFLGVKYGG